MSVQKLKPISAEIIFVIAVGELEIENSSLDLPQAIQFPRPASALKQAF
jgi:hypothetical protein